MVGVGVAATVATELVFCCAVVFLSISVDPVPQHHRMHHYTGAVRRSYVILYNNRLDANAMFGVARV